MNPTRELPRSRTEHRQANVFLCTWTPIASASLALCLSAPLVQAEDINHTVARGDTLWSIAQRHTGQPGRWPGLQRANRLANPNLLSVGQVLTIPTRLVALPETSAAVVFVHGDVRVTLPGRSESEALQIGANVPEGAVIDVRDKSFARLRLSDGSAFGLSARSRARLALLRLNTGTQQSQTLIRMDAGRVESEVTPKRHPGSRFEVHTPMAVASVRGTRFGVSASDSATTGEVDEGVVQMGALVREGAHAKARRVPVLLSAGEGARVDSRGRLERATRLPAPDLAGLPAEFDDGNQVRFNLPASGQAQAYRLQVRDAAAPDAVLQEAWVTDPLVTWAALRDGSYILAMQSVDTLGLLGNTSRHGFSVVSGPVPPLYRYPAPGEKLPGPTVSLRCTEPDGALGYRWQIARDAAFTDLVADRKETGDCQLSASLSAGIYHWRVATLGADNRQGPYGGTTRFEVLPTEAPTGSEFAASVQQPRLSAYWTAKPGLSYRVQIARDAAFTQPVFDGWLPEARLDLPAAERGMHFLRWQSRDADGRLSPLSATHRLPVQTFGLQTSDGEPVKTGTDQRPVTTQGPPR